MKVAALAQIVTILFLFASPAKLLAQRDPAAVAREQFDVHWFPESSRVQLQDLVRLRVENIDRVCRLSDAQRAKLTLAGQGDLRAFWRRVEEVRAQYIEAAGDRLRTAAVWKQVTELFDERSHDFFSEDKLLLRAVPATLDEEQLKRYGSDRAERRRYRWQAQLTRGIARLELAVPLADHQRRQLIRLLIERLGPSDPTDDDAVLQLRAILFRVPEAEVRSILDERQWQSVRRYFADLDANAQP